FQTAGELYDALLGATSATGDASAGSFQAAATVANAPIGTVTDDLDEETVVRPRDEETVVRRRPETPPYAQPIAQHDAAAGFSPWRIIIPSAIVLVVVFGVVFLLTRGSSQTPTTQTQGQNGLVVDPNSQPVEAGSPPTGASEHGIEPLPTTSPALTNPNTN